MDIESGVIGISRMTDAEIEAFRSAVARHAAPGNDPSPYMNMSELWRASERGARIQAAYVQKNWVPLVSLSGIIGEGFRAINPPAFLVDGVAWVPEYDFQCFVSEILRIEHEIRDRKYAEERGRNEVIKKRRRSVVYFIQDGKDGPIKIGFTSNIGQRLSDLQTNRHTKLFLLAKTPGGGARERAFHLQFSHLRVMREWFRPDPEFLEFIASLRRNT